MNANPPGVDELDPEELELRFAGEEPVAELVTELDPDEVPAELPPVTPEGHHQTHSVPVSADSTPVAN